MKKRSLKIIAMIIVMCFIVGCMPVSADTNIETNTPATTIKINEYEEITELQKNTAEELQAKGYSEQEAEEILSFSYRDALLERATMSDTALKNLGYNEKQIEFLREFANNPNGDYDFQALENDINIWFTILSGANSNTTKKIRASWNWVTVPVITKTDVFAVRWVGVDSLNHYIDLTSPSGSSNRYASVNYVNDYGPARTNSISVVPADGFNSLSISFKEGDTYNGDIIWAKSGSLTFTVKVKNTANPMSYVKVMATYGHDTFSFSFGFDINYSGQIGVTIVSVGLTNSYKNRNRVADINSAVVYY